MIKKDLIYIIYVSALLILTAYFSFKIYGTKNHRYEFLYVKDLPGDNPGFRDIRAYNCSLKPNNTFRIIVLGDSFTWGGGINEEEKTHIYPSELEQLLNQNSSKIKYEVINFGVPGHTMTQKVEEFKRYALSCEHDFVILQFLEDDASDKTKMIEIYKELLKNFLKEKKIQNQSEIGGEIEFELKAEAISKYFDELWSNYTFSEILKDYVELPLKELVDMINSSNSVLVVSIPLCPDELNLYSRFIPFVKQLVDKYNWYFLDMEKLYSKYNPSELIVNPVPPRDCHPNLFAHKMVAEEIFKTLVINKIIESTN